MTAKDLFSNVVVLKTSDTGQAALSLMEELKVSHLPIVNNEEFLGLISQSDIYNLNSPDEPVGNHILSISKQYIELDKDIFEIIKLFSEQKLTLLPVLDKKQNYIGSISRYSLIQEFSKMAAVENPGGTITIELNQSEYSLSEIAQIVESNDAKILSLFVTSFPNSTKLEVTMKLNKMDIRPVLQTFYRYSYNVTASHTQEEYHDNLKDRFDSLMNYLNI